MHALDRVVEPFVLVTSMYAWSKLCRCRVLCSVCDVLDVLLGYFHCRELTTM
jgi:hypothetical protein